MGKDSIKRKRFRKARNSKFKRAFARERNKISVEISELIHESKVLVEKINQNQCENDNSIVKQTNGFHTKLRNWALKHNVKTSCIRDLLKILNSIGVPFLPKDPRTFLCTPKIVEVENIANGQFWYSGIATKLHKMLQAAEDSMELELNFHVDGVQLFNSSSKQFWPILGQIHG